MRKKVDERERKEALSTLGTQFQPILAKKLKFAWQFAVKTDIKYVFLFFVARAFFALSLTCTTRLAPMNRYQTTVANYDVDPNSLSDRLISNVLLSAAQADPTTYHHLLRVAHLTATPLSLVADPRTWKPLLSTSYFCYSSITHSLTHACQHNTNNRSLREAIEGQLSIARHHHHLPPLLLLYIALHELLCHIYNDAAKGIPLRNVFLDSLNNSASLTSPTSLAANSKLDISSCCRRIVLYNFYMY